MPLNVVRISWSVGLAAAVGLTVSISASAQDAKRSIEPVTGDVYRFQNDFHNAMFVVTEDGIVVTDPINAEAVAWLKDEMAERFDKPVTHMILSHTHGDHASGMENGVRLCYGPAVGLSPGEGSIA
jgi:glyoxylase-like metal-dependent hydrolase (beta-lactamase superfamily II)